jgi:hypothetical protein
MYLFRKSIGNLKVVVAVYEHAVVRREYLLHALRYRPLPARSGDEAARLMDEILTPIPIDLKSLKPLR